MSDTTLIPKASSRESEVLYLKIKAKGTEEQAKFAKEYFVEVEGKIQKILGTFPGVLDTNMILKAFSWELKVSYPKMKADHNRLQKLIMSPMISTWFRRSSCCLVR